MFVLLMPRPIWPGLTHGTRVRCFSQTSVPVYPIWLSASQNPLLAPDLRPRSCSTIISKNVSTAFLYTPPPLSSRVPIHLSLPPWPLLADALYANDLLLYPFPPFPFLPHPPLRNATPSDSGNYAMIGGGVPRIGARPGDSAATSITNEIAYDITPNASQYSLPAVGAVLSVG